MTRKRPLIAKPCFGCRGPKRRHLLVCGRCWDRVPTELVGEWFAACDSRDRLTKVAAARRILEFLRGC